jgi:hypothetical protein
VSALAAVAERRRQENEALRRQAKQAHALGRSEAFAGLSAEAQDRVVDAKRTQPQLDMIPAGTLYP